MKIPVLVGVQALEPTQELLEHLRYTAIAARLLIHMTGTAGNEDEKACWVENWLDVSDVGPGNYPAEEDRLITFSTCSHEYNDACYVLIAILKKFSGDRA